MYIMSEDLEVSIASICKLLNTKPTPAQEKFCELYGRIMKSPPEYSMPIIFGAVIELVSVLDDMSMPRFNRERAKTFYKDFFTQKYHAYKSAESARLRTV